jgi:prophage tail gpP-like protein
MRGILDTLDEDISKTSRSTELSGRDMAGQLLDCAAPIFTAEQISLPALVKKIVAPFGITQVRIDASDPLTRTKVNVEPGDTAWSALQRAAEANGLWPWFEPTGVLVIGRPDYTTTPVASLVMRQVDAAKNNILGAHRTRSLHDVYSEVDVLGQTPGTVKSGGHRGILAKATSPNVGLYRPHFVTDHECDNAKVAKNRAAKLLSDGLLEADNLTVKVRGHRTDNGTPWTPGQRVKVSIEPYNIDGEIWFVMGRTFTGGKDVGQVTELKLKRDGLWQIEAHPHKGTHRRGKNHNPVSTTFAN